MEANANKRFSLLSFPETGHVTPHRAIWKSISAGQEAERNEGKAQATAFIRGSMEKARQGRVALFGLACLISSDELRDTGAVPSCVVPGPGWLGVEDVGVTCQSEIRRASGNGLQVPGEM